LALFWVGKLLLRSLDTVLDGLAAAEALQALFPSLPEKSLLSVDGHVYRREAPSRSVDSGVGYSFQPKCRFGGWMWLPTRLRFPDLEVVPCGNSDSDLGYGSGPKFGFGLWMLLHGVKRKDRAKAASPEPSS
jgi:hypothetical protein